MKEAGHDDKLERIVMALHDVNVALESVRTILQGLQNLSCDHEGRLRTIERWQHNLTPILAAMTFVLGITTTHVINRFF